MCQHHKVCAGKDMPPMTWQEAFLARLPWCQRRHSWHASRDVTGGVPGTPPMMSEKAFLARLPWCHRRRSWHASHDIRGGIPGTPSVTSWEACQECLPWGDWYGYSNENSNKILLLVSLFIFSHLYCLILTQTTWYINVQGLNWVHNGRHESYRNNIEIVGRYTHTFIKASWIIVKMYKFVSWGG